MSMLVDVYVCQLMTNFCLNLSGIDYGGKDTITVLRLVAFPQMGTGLCPPRKLIDRGDTFFF